MAASSNTQTLLVFIFLFSGLYVNCSQDSTVKVNLGYIFNDPRDQHLQAARVVLTDHEKDLKLVCSINPPLPRGIWNDFHRDELVVFVKVAPEYKILHGPRYWPDEQTSTAISIKGNYMDQLGTYACSYRGVWSYIDIVANEDIAKRLPVPHNMVNLEKYVMYRTNRSSVPGWSDSQPRAEAEGAAFPCIVSHPKKTPSSVHHLQPSQIRVVAAMGDSVTAAFGAEATDIKDYFIQHRGASWSIGGDGSLDTSITLPNILKKFSELNGYSEGQGRNYSMNTQLNVARAGATARDLQGQAQILIRKLKTSPDINYLEDWKMVTVLGGQQDLCRLCMDKDSYSSSNYVHSVIQALKELQKVPKVLVNLVPPFDVSLLSKLRKEGHQCKVMNVDACPCSESSNANLTFMREVHSKYVSSLTEVVESGMFEKNDNFTVVIRPVFERMVSESLDRDLFSIDCFHLSRKGHSHAALSLWNSMVGNVNARKSVWTGQPHLQCPTKKNPYIITRLNLVWEESGSDYSKQESDRKGMPVGVVIFLSIFLGGVFILILGLVYRSRKSRPRDGSLLSLVNNPHRAKI